MRAALIMAVALSGLMFASAYCNLKTYHVSWGPHSRIKFCTLYSAIHTPSHEVIRCIMCFDSIGISKEARAHLR